MKALTLKRPWPAAIFRLGKNFENRGWKPPRSIIGQRIAIHAGKRWDAEGAEWIAHKTGVWLRPDEPEGFIGTVRVPEWACMPLPSPISFWAFGPECWPIVEPRELKTPIPYAGKLGLWEVPADIERMILEAEAAR